MKELLKEVKAAIKESKAEIYDGADDATKKMITDVTIPMVIMFFVAIIVGVANGYNFFLSLIAAIFLAPLFGMLYYSVNLSSEDKKMLDAKSKIEQEDREQFYRDRKNNA